MIRFIGCKFDEAQDLIPQAIFGRALKFFVSNFGRSNDDLDFFDGAMFCFMNEFQFALKHYDGHPEFTVTLYIESQISDIREISDAISKVISGFRLPESAVRWKRGDDFDCVSQEKPDRLYEHEARILVLKIASLQKNHEASTALIKQQVPEYRPMSAADLSRSPSRKNESMWQQVVGNVKVHYKTSKSIFKLGYAERTSDGVRITREGLAYLDDMGFPTSYKLA